MEKYYKTSEKITENQVVRSMIYQKILTVTGGNVHFMVGIKDLKYFPEQVF